MSKSFRKDLTGQRFGRLTVIEFVPNNKRNSHWLCKCDCGKETIVADYHLKSRRTQSCGCLQREWATEHGKEGKHHLEGTAIYKCWCHIKARCYNPHCPAYKNYGGRGIIVCDEWKESFQAFYEWSIKNGYKENSGLSIDRVDNDKGYFPENCRWTDRKTQQRNRRNNVIVEYQGEKMTLPEAAEISDISLDVLYARYYNGDRGERLFRPVKKNN